MATPKLGSLRHRALSELVWALAVWDAKPSGRFLDEFYRVSARRLHEYPPAQVRAARFWARGAAAAAAVVLNVVNSDSHVASQQGAIVCVRALLFPIHISCAPLMLLVTRPSPHSLASMSPTPPFPFTLSLLNIPHKIADTLSALSKLGCRAPAPWLGGMLAAFCASLLVAQQQQQGSAAAAAAVGPEVRSHELVAVLEAAVDIADDRVWLGQVCEGGRGFGYDQCVRAAPCL